MNTFEQPATDASQASGWHSSPGQGISLDVPMREYNCLSPIHEVVTPLATPCHSPSHSPMMRRVSGSHGFPSLRLQSSEEEPPQPEIQVPPAPKKLIIPEISISIDEVDSEKKYTSRGTEAAEVIPDVLIHVPPEVTLDSRPDEPESSSPTWKSKPPPLVFANDKLSRCSGVNEFQKKKKDEEDDDESKSTVHIPVFVVESATPTIEEIGFPKFTKNFSPELFQKENVSIIANKEEPISPVCKPLIPPVIITINQSSEAESDSDTQGKCLTAGVKLPFLTPFVGTSDRVPSESNLSTSGYSSMASPCPSRCPSVSPLCTSETDDFHHCGHEHHHSGQRRSSLTYVAPKKPIASPMRRLSLNSAMLSSTFHNSLGYPDEPTFCRLLRNQVAISATLLEVDTDSAVEMENLEADGNESSPPEQVKIPQEDLKDFTNLLQVPKKSLPKSRSLDISSDSNNSEKNTKGSSASSQKLKFGESLDSKLNILDPSKRPDITFVKKEATSEKIGLSPVSSRSESEVSVGGTSIRNSGVTDSDGLYDCGSSEVPSRLSMRRRSFGKKKERKGSKGNKEAEAEAEERKNASLDDGSRSSKDSRENADKKNASTGDLRSEKKKGKQGSPNSSSKKRVRAQPKLNQGTSSSSSESLNSLRSVSSGTLLSLLG